MDKKIILEFDRKQKSSKQKRSKDSGHSSNTKAKQPKVEEPESVKLSALYRDRAKERREGINKDFELDPDDLRISNPTIGNAQSEDEDQLISEAERRRQQIEESKYLGGDIEHTHLVKGLDFALLEKVKNDQKLAEKLAVSSDKDLAIGIQDSDSEEEEFRNEAILAASSVANSKRQIVDIDKLKKGHSTELIQCRTALARRILNVLDEKWPEKSELFTPGRMSYTVNIDEESDDPVTTVLNSRADASSLNESKLPNEADFALDQLVNILAKVRKCQASDAADSKKLKNWEKSDTIDDYSY